MSIEPTKALVPFEGIIQPVKSVGHRGMDKYGNDDRMGRMIGNRYKNNRILRNYDRLGNTLNGRSTLGEMVDIFV